jgi:hypothetical protein
MKVNGKRSMILLVFDEMRDTQRRLEVKIDNLSNSLDGAAKRQQAELNDMKVAMARVDEKVLTHSRGLSAIGAMLVAAISGLFTNLIFRWVK